MLDGQNYLQNHTKNNKATKFLLQSAFYISEGRTCKVLHFYDFGLNFMISSVAPTLSSTFCAYLIIIIGNRKIKVVVRAEILPRDFLQTPGNYYL